MGGLCPEWRVYWQVMEMGMGLLVSGIEPCALREAVLLREGEKDGGGGKEESERWRGLGQCRSDLSAAHPSAGTELLAGQRDAGAERGHEMFPPCPETGGSRNPTGNLAPMELLTWPWYGAPQPCRPTGQVHPTGTAGEEGGTAGTPLCPSPLPLPWGGQKGGSHGR